MPLERLRVVDPVLTTTAQGYRNAEHIGRELFPIVNVSKEGGKIIKYGKEAFRIYNTRRAIRSKTARIEVGADTIDYNLEEEALEAAVDDREKEEAETPIRPEIQRTKTVMDSISLKMEYDQATRAQDSNSYDSGNVETLSGTDQWSDYSNSDPVKVVKECKEIVRSKIAAYPNTLVLGASTYNTLTEHPKLLDKIKYSMKGVLTKDLMEQIFDIEKILVGKAVYAGADDSFNDLWGNVAILAYVPKERDADVGVPAFGYTLRKTGRPQTTKYRDEGANSVIIRVADIFDVKVVGNVAGFLIKDAIATE